jgi:hypothetical protein
VNATLAIWVMSLPCAESSTVCARRHVTTDPEQRRTIRNSRLPSSFANSRTRNPHAPLLLTSTRISLRDHHLELVDLQGQGLLQRHVARPATFALSRRSPNR